MITINHWDWVGFQLVLLAVSITAMYYKGKYDHEKLETGRVTDRLVEAVQDNIQMVKLIQQEDEPEEPVGRRRIFTFHFSDDREPVTVEGNYLGHFKDVGTTVVNSDGHTSDFVALTSVIHHIEVKPVPIQFGKLAKLILERIQDMRNRNSRAEAPVLAELTMLLEAASKEG